MVGRRCGCAGTCSCDFEAGRGASLTGSAPILVEVLDGQAFVRGAATETVEALVSGAGSADDPYVVTMNSFAGVSQPIIFLFTTPGTYVWEKPTFGTMVAVSVGGGGGGGCAPGYALSGSAGQGGLGGNIRDVTLMAADVPSAVTVTVGAGGNGAVGPSYPAGPSAAVVGTDGQPSRFGSLVYAAGGAGGIYSPTTPPTAVVRQGGFGGFRAGSAFVAGGRGGRAYTFSPGGSNGGGGAPAWPAGGAPAEPGRSPLAGLLNPAGGGGGGGGASATVTGVRDGAQGGIAAGGGGGQQSVLGSSPNQVTGSGGRGGDGFVRILIQ